MFQKFIKYPAVFAVLILAFSLLLVTVNALPVSPMSINLHESADTLLKQDDAFPKDAQGKANGLSVDNFTSAIMLDIASHGSDMGIRGAFGGYYPKVSNDISQAQNLAQTIDTSALDSATQVSYGYYWHGWKVWLKPLLYLFNISQIQFLLFILMSILIFVAATMLCRLKGSVAGVVFGACYAVVLYPICCMSLSFASTFFLSLIMSIRVLYEFTKHKRHLNKITTKSRSGAYGLSNEAQPEPAWGWQIEFFVVGAFTAYLDFLCTPIISLAVPLALLTFLQDKATLEKNLCLIFGCLILWGLGYGLTWIIKWPISQAITGEPVIANALDEVLYRSGETEIETASQTQTISRMGVLAKQIQTFIPSNLLILICVLVVLTIIIFALVGNRVRLRQTFQRTVPLVLLAILPYAWYLFALNHSSVHYWFTYRNQLVTVMALCFCALLLLKKPVKPPVHKRYSC